jgi:hypothetical protein
MKKYKMQPTEYTHQNSSPMQPFILTLFLLVIVNAALPGMQAAASKYHQAMGSYYGKKAENFNGKQGFSQRNLSE